MRHNVSTYNWVDWFPAVKIYIRLEADYGTGIEITHILRIFTPTHTDKHLS